MTWMRTRRSRCGNKQAGFTLLELLITLSLLAILVCIVVATYVVSTSRARDSACKANLKILEKAVMEYRIDLGHWPAQMTDLKPDYIRGNFTFKDPEGADYNYDPATGEVSCPIAAHNQ